MYSSDESAATGDTMSVCPAPVSQSSASHTVLHSITYSISIVRCIIYKEQDLWHTLFFSVLLNKKQHSAVL